MLISTSMGVLLVWALSMLPIPNDIKFESGYINQTVYHPYFVEQYQQPHTMCTSTGKSTVCTTYYTTEKARHYEYWTVADTLNNEWKVTRDYHNKIKQDFGNKVSVSKPNKCTHGGKIVSGDPNLYTYWNVTRTYDYPTNDIVRWHNPLKQKRNTFKKNTNYKKQYPKSVTYEQSNRLINEDTITKKDWDKLNSILYEQAQGVNVILVKVSNAEEAKQLEDAWINGKQNDLIICVKGSYNNPEFVKVFGWSKYAIVKRKLETHILDNGITKDNLPEIIEIIKKEYQPYNFNKFKYIVLAPSIWVILLAFIVAFVIGKLCYNEFSTNWDRKED